MHRVALALVLAAGLAVAVAPPARAQDGDDDVGQVMEAAPQPSPDGGGNKQGEKARALALMLAVGLAVPGLVLLAVVLRTGLSLTAAAAFPALTRRAGAWIRTRPWLCFGWGAVIGLLVIIAVLWLFHRAHGSEVIALSLLLSAAMATGVGTTGAFEVVGEGLLALRGVHDASRLTHLTVGSAVLTVGLLTPPGWLGLVFLLPCGLGAWRLALQGGPARHDPATEPDWAAASGAVDGPRPTC